MDGWRKYFGSKILERGLDYYNSNAVRIYICSTDCIEAQVAGSRIYDVRINFEDSKIQSMHCNCPYEGNCKHLAALLYYVENHPELLEMHDDVSELVLSFSHAELAEFLLNELPKNPDLLNKLKLLKNHADDSYYENKLQKCYEDPLKLLKFIDDDLYDLKQANQIDLILRLSESIVNFSQEMVLYGQYDVFDEIIVKIDDLMNRLANTGFEDQVCDFLAECILNSDDESVLDLFTDTYSRFRCVEKLFDDNSTKVR